MPKFGDPKRADPVFQSSCLECGKPVFGSHKGQPRKFCDKIEGERASKCSVKYRRRKYLEKHGTAYRRRKLQRVKADPVRREAYAATMRKVRSRYNRKQNAQNKKIGRQRFEMIDAAVPKHYIRDTRMEIVAEACLLYAEGHTLEECVKLATKRVNKGNELQNYKSKDIDDCFWLGDDTGMPY